jgi:hypothetical protein
MQTPDVMQADGLSVAETLTKLGADAKTGLRDAEAQARLKKYEPDASTKVRSPCREPSR